MTQARRALVLGVVLIVAANLLGGLSYPAQKMALRGLPPVTLMLVRNGVALLMMIAILAWRRIGFATYTKRDFARVGVLGLFGYGLPMLLGIIGVGMSTASNASILVLLEPPVIVVIAWLFLREHISFLKVLAIAFGLAGAGAIVLEDASLSDLLGGEHLAGNAVLALHGVLWGIYTPFIKTLARRQDPFGITALTLAVAIPPFVPFAVMEWPTWEWSPLVVESLWWAAAVGVFSSFGATLLWIASLRYLAASTTAPFVFLQPFAGVCAGVLFLDESMTSAGILGAILISVGVLLATRREA